jgi:hypothetical protein
MGSLRVVTLILAMPVVAVVGLLAAHALLGISLGIGERHYGHTHVTVHVRIAHRV